MTSNMYCYRNNQIAAFHSLKGERIIGCTVLEMALREDGPDGQPQFSDPAAPFVQAWALYLTLASGRIYCFHTWQDDDLWALACRAVESIPVTAMADIFRWRNMVSNLIGTITGIDLVLSEKGNIRRLTCCTSQGQVIIAAGEADVQQDGSLKVHCDDACVLVFESEDAARRWL